MILRNDWDTHVASLSASHVENAHKAAAWFASWTGGPATVKTPN